MDVYSHNDYRSLINSWLQNEAGRGGQRRLAEAAGCLPSYLSQVLSGSAELTPDQAYGMTSVMGIDRESSDFFMLLLQRDRASSKIYKEHLTKRLAETKSRKQKMSERLSPGRVLSGDQLARYYAAWHYSAIHTLSAIPEFQSVKELERRLRLSREVIDHAIDNLEKMELVRRDGQKVTALARNVHADSTSALNFSFHSVWRAIGNQRMQELPPGKNVHYTALYGLSKADSQKLKSMMLEFIQKTRDVVGPSSEETASVMICDFFEL